MKTFKSKVGAEILAPTGAVFLLCILLPYLDGAPIEALWTISIILIAVGTLVVFTLFGASYTITPDHQLDIRCGFIYHLEVNIMTIKSIKKSRSIMKAPASSIDRIEITFNKNDAVLISPKDKLGFLKALLNINPNIESHI